MLEKQLEKLNALIFTFIYTLHLFITYRARHNEVRLRVEITTEYIIAVSFESLETFSLKEEHQQLSTTSL